MKINKINKGFTLVELLVVISIIGILTTLLMVNFVGSRERATDSQKIQNLNSIKNALRMYYNDNQTYPANKTIILGNGFTGYMSNIGDTSFTYSQTNNGDGFILKINLGAGGGSNESQISCNLTPTPGVYAVCAN